MVKKRLIFTLLYDNGYFMHSRNFRLQRVGNVEWLNRNYNFTSIANAIDELVILDVGRDVRLTDRFFSDVEAVTRDCFMPLALGGGVVSADDVSRMMSYGADKIVINTLLSQNPEVVREIVTQYGSQCVIASVDYRLICGEFVVFTDRGMQKSSLPLSRYLEYLADLRVGEVYLNSIDRDGTGQGYCLEVLEHIDGVAHLPIIMAGGAGSHNHLMIGINHLAVDAVATANLFNFVGDGLPRARNYLIDDGVELARW